LDGKFILPPQNTFRYLVVSYDRFNVTGRIEYGSDDKTIAQSYLNALRAQTKDIFSVSAERNTRYYLYTLEQEPETEQAVAQEESPVGAAEKFVAAINAIANKPDTAITVNFREWLDKRREPVAA